MLVVEKNRKISCVINSVSLLNIYGGSQSLRLCASAPLRAKNHPMTPNPGSLCRDVAKI
ncbi:MAG: hypothetical protein HEQ20_14115 [Aphanizomenon flos-aquae KM1D3_PB]|uniref:hypothetical protein n=1 Tax=Aphanizomenon flos-aquae TaxID=1176 RepID=UPI001364198B|nr:hypothetical protein [Aphanizomenon flos-aquae]QSV71676.1 MAG: hypothetical protein HEQ20_14115 [Aphanizomenon flos-aquae KM1D3_PB]